MRRKYKPSPLPQNIQLRRTLPPPEAPPVPTELSFNDQLATTSMLLGQDIVKSGPPVEGAMTREDIREAVRTLEKRSVGPYRDGYSPMFIHDEIMVKKPLETPDELLKLFAQQFDESVRKTLDVAQKARTKVKQAKLEDYVSPGMAFDDESRYNRLRKQYIRATDANRRHKKRIAELEEELEKYKTKDCASATTVGLEAEMSLMSGLPLPVVLEHVKEFPLDIGPLHRKLTASNLERLDLRKYVWTMIDTRLAPGDEQVTWLPDEEKFHLLKQQGRANSVFTVKEARTLPTQCLVAQALMFASYRKEQRHEFLLRRSLGLIIHVTVETSPESEADAEIEEKLQLHCPPPLREQFEKQIKGFMEDAKANLKSAKTE